MNNYEIIDLVYYLMVGVFFTHELDAVRRREWRILPITSSLPDRLGEHVFIWLHIPIFTLLLSAGDGQSANALRVGLSVFAIIHVGLHWMFRNHPANEFNNTGSWALILSTGVLGATYLFLISVS